MSDKPDVNATPEPRDLGEVCNNQLMTAGKIGLVALALGSAIAVGYLWAHKKHAAEERKPNVAYVGNTNTQYFDHGPTHEGLNFDVDNEDKRQLLLIEDFVKSGYLGSDYDDAEDQMTRVIFYEHNNYLCGDSTPGKLSNRELGFILQGCRQWVSLPSEMKENKSFFQWYMSDFAPKYRKFVKEDKK